MVYFRHGAGEVQHTLLVSWAGEKTPTKDGGYGTDGKMEDEICRTVNELPSNGSTIRIRGFEICFGMKS